MIKYYTILSIEVREGSYQVNKMQRKIILEMKTKTILRLIPKIN